MKKIILFIVLFVLGVKGFTQEKIPVTNAKEENIICLCCGPINPSKQPLWVVNGKVVSQLNLPALNPNYIETINILKDREALTKYGEAAKNGVLIITLKRNIKAYAITKILSKNRIDIESRKLPIYLNNVFVVGDSIFLSSNKKIKAVIVEANSNVHNTKPFNGKYIAVSEIK